MIGLIQRKETININLNTPFPMAAFTQDFEYLEGLGDLVQCVMDDMESLPNFPKAFITMFYR